MVICLEFAVSVRAFDSLRIRELTGAQAEICKTSVRAWGLGRAGLWRG